MICKFVPFQLNNIKDQKCGVKSGASAFFRTNRVQFPWRAMPPSVSGINLPFKSSVSKCVLKKIIKSDSMLNLEHRLRNSQCLKSKTNFK